MDFFTTRWTFLLFFSSIRHFEHLSFIFLCIFHNDILGKARTRRISRVYARIMKLMKKTMYKKKQKNGKRNLDFFVPLVVVFAIFDN